MEVTYVCVNRDLGFEELMFLLRILTKMRQMCNLSENDEIEER